MPPRQRTRTILACSFFGVVALASAFLPATAQAQGPEPGIPDINQRSGLISRFIPIIPQLPPDPRRDDWYDTRFGDPPNHRPHRNWYPNGGLYGLRWPTKDTASIYPFFFGAPGQSSLTEESRPPHPLLRLPRAVFHPFKPVGMYYDQGSYVPIYDPRPIVPGPGAWPWPFFWSPTHGGG